MWRVITAKVNREKRATARNTEMSTSEASSNANGIDVIIEPEISTKAG
jgi:hypothetical protein